MATTKTESRGLNLTLHQLRIVWSVAHAETVSRAAKQLGLSQPTLSQQIAKLEAAIGHKVFQRRAARMVLTEIGTFLVERAEQVMRDVQQLEDGLGAFAGGTRTVGIVGIGSPLRVLMPKVLQRFHENSPGIDFDLHEASPGDALAMLYARRANLGIIAASSIAQASMGFVQVPLLDDPYVLVVPESLDLASVRKSSDLGEAQREVLNSAVHFVYGTQHQKRIENWYEAALPEHKVVARCRSFEVAVSMVQAGLGVCIAPALSCLSGDMLLAGIRLYDPVLELPRPLVALVPSQYRRLQPYAALIETMQEVAKDVARPPIAPLPAFLRNRIPAA